MKFAKTTLLFLILLCCVCSGCTHPEENDSPEDAVMAQSAIDAPSYAPVDVADIKCGFIFKDEPVYDGIDMLIEHGLKAEQIMIAQNVNPESIDSFREALELQISEGCFLIFVNDVAFAEYCDIMAQDNPDVLICCKDVKSTGFNNYIGYHTDNAGDFYCRAVQTVVNGTWNGEDYYE